jgi:hypothetical protein
LPLVLFLKKDNVSPINKLIPLIPFLISLILLSFEAFIYFDFFTIIFHLLGMIFTLLFIFKPS